MLRVKIAGRRPLKHFLWFLHVFTSLVNVASLSHRGDWNRGSGQLGTVEIAGVENAGVENVVPSIKGENTRVSVKIKVFFGLLFAVVIFAAAAAAVFRIGRKDSVCAPMEWLTADRNCIRLYAPLS